MDRSDSGINKYQYDAISQLTKAELPWGDTQEYTYDQVGNRLEMKDKRGIQWYKYDYGDQLLEIESTFNPEGNDMNLALQAKVSVSDEAPPRFKTTFTYDEAGNQVSKTGPGKQTSLYSYDSLNRMVGMDAPGLTPQANTFDTQDRRIGIAGGESEGKTFLRGACGSAILNEVSSKGKATDRYIVLPDGRLVGRVENTGNKVSFYHFDALGNTIATSDKAGNITSTQVYEPFGASRSTPPFKDMFGFVGEHGVESADGELMRMGARFYNEIIGAFISRDYLLLSSLSNTWVYVYSQNSPISSSDPFGLETPRYPSVGECAKQVIDVGLKNAVSAYGSRSSSFGELKNNHISPDTDSGNAILHCTWSCKMAKTIGPEAAKKVGDNHEKLGDNSSKDLSNNSKGIELAGKVNSPADCFNACSKASLTQ
jgi:RHS repeat-associated protein